MNDAGSAHRVRSPQSPSAARSPSSIAGCMSCAPVTAECPKQMRPCGRRITSLGAGAPSWPKKNPA